MPPALTKTNCMPIPADDLPQHCVGCCVLWSFNYQAIHPRLIAGWSKLCRHPPGWDEPSVIVISQCHHRATVLAPAPHEDAASLLRPWLDRTLLLVLYVHASRRRSAVRRVVPRLPPVRDDAWSHRGCAGGVARGPGAACDPAVGSPVAVRRFMNELRRRAPTMLGATFQPRNVTALTSRPPHHRRPRRRACVLRS